MADNEWKPEEMQAEKVNGAWITRDGFKRPFCPHLQKVLNVLEECKLYPSGVGSLIQCFDSSCIKYGMQDTFVL